MRRQPEKHIKLISETLRTQKRALNFYKMQQERENPGNTHRIFRKKKKKSQTKKIGKNSTAKWRLHKILNCHEDVAKTNERGRKGKSKTGKDLKFAEVAKGIPEQSYRF